MADFVVDPQGNVEDVRGGAARKDSAKIMVEPLIGIPDFNTPPGTYLELSDKQLMISYRICFVLVVAAFLAALSFQIASSLSYARAKNDLTHTTHNFPTENEVKGRAYGGAASGCFLLGMTIIGVGLAIKIDSSTSLPSRNDYTFNLSPYLGGPVGCLGAALILLAMAIIGAIFSVSDASSWFLP